jgi:anaerobic selenocysteine-containing dehydrogenase
MHNSERLVRGKDRCTLLMNPRDASARSLSDGQMARVRSRVGELSVAVEVTDAMMPGVVSLPHGWGHDRPGVRLATATRHAGVSINDLTDELRLDQLSGNAAFSGVDVIVERATPAHS